MISSIRLFQTQTPRTKGWCLKVKRKEGRKERKKERKRERERERDRERQTDNETTEENKFQGLMPRFGQNNTKMRFAALSALDYFPVGKSRLWTDTDHLERRNHTKLFNTTCAQTEQGRNPVIDSQVGLMKYIVSHSPALPPTRPSLVMISVNCTACSSLLLQ